LFLHEGGFVPIKPLLEPRPAAPKPRKVVDPAVASLIRDILTRHPDRVLTFGRNSNNRLQFDGAMKTGTSNQFNNIWAVGFTTDLLGGVWMGNFGGQTVVGTADSGYPAGAMRKMLEAFSAHRPFPELTGFHQITICSLSGMAATDNCPYKVMEWYRPGTEPRPCDWHMRGPSGIDVRYPQEYQAWLSRYRYRPSDGYQTADLAIVRPLDGSVFFMDPGIPLGKQQLVIEGTGKGIAELAIDGITVLRGSFPFKTWYQLKPGNHRIVLSNGSAEMESEYEVR
jgi:penicillin-binding protein 1C